MRLTVSLLTFVISLAALVLGQSDDLLPSNALPQNPTVSIAQGSVIGSLSEDGSYAQFFGIPYADSTSGINRFKAPRPPPSFQEPFTANRRDIKCVRALGQGYEGTEDCLVASVFTKSLDSTSLLPVVVWVKGKEFDKVHEHEPSFENFMERDVVVVSLNFRESVLGFLCLGTETAPGNAGLKDIIMGLRWVQLNILQFGGNPYDVTLIGHGSGAAAVDLITLSPMASGLVHKAIIQSGNALAPWAVSRDNTHFAILVAEALGHRITNIEDLSNTFTRMSVPALMSIINELDLTDNSLAFAPCVERTDLAGVEPFLTKTPIEIFNAREHLQIPLIMGYVDNEGTIRSEEAIEDDWVEKMNESFDDFLQPDLEFSNNNDKETVSQQIRNYYFENQDINMNNINRYINYHGDTLILVSTLREARLRARTSTAPFYLYQFSYKGSLGEPFVGPVPVNSAAHSEELAYMFHTEADDTTTIPTRDMVVGDILVERWTNFAATDQPQSYTSTVFWRPYTAANPFFLHILDNAAINTQTDVDVVLQNPHPDKLAFWDPIYEAHFLDAESTWELNGRDEDDNTDGSGNGIGSGSGDGTGNGSGNGSGDGTGDGSGDGSGDGTGNGSGDGTGNGTGNGSGDGTGDGSGDGTGDGSGNGSGDGDGNGADNSASTAIGYTFSIIAVFAVLNKLHLSQLMS